jgi:integrase
MMSVKVRSYRNGGMEVDIAVVLPDGTRYRERKVQKASKSVALQWGNNRERFLLTHGRPAPAKEVPTLQEFAPRFLETYEKADRHKPSGVASKESILRVHLIPTLGSQKLDAITNTTVQQLKLRLHDKSPKTVNNVLSVLSTLLKTAVEWGLIQQLPCSIRLLPVPKRDAAFHDFDAYERLLSAAKSIDWRTYLIVLLGGECGLRVGEIVALE